MKSNQMNIIARNFVIYIALMIMMGELNKMEILNSLTVMFLFLLVMLMLIIDIYSIFKNHIDDQYGNKTNLLIDIMMTAFKAIIYIIIAALFVCTPIVFDLLVSIFLKVGEYSSLKYLSNINLNSNIGISEFINYAISLTSASIMAIFSFLSYKINKQQFEILDNINNNKPKIRIVSENNKYELKIDLSDLSKMLSGEVQQISLTELITLLESNPHKVYPDSYHLSKITIQNKFYVHSSVDNKSVLVLPLDNNYSNLKSTNIKYLPNYVEYKINGSSSEKYAIVNSSDLTIYEITAIKNFKELYDRKSKYVGLEVRFETDHEIIYKGMFIDIDMINKLFIDKLKIIVANAIKNSDNERKTDFPELINQGKYNNLKELIEANNKKFICLKGNSDIIKDVMAEKKGNYLNKYIGTSNYF